ncbi:MAG TPA: SGNH/GDSL hydrolase family protein [Solirubrobacteraceae bacterium]|nr:SGNH/GDSL hydrolase family protein [Solirubrobacteraceae bacterium]
MLRRVRVLVVLASLAGALSVGAAGASAADWAGLGDSYAAGPLIPNQQLSPLGCLRSDHNFAHLAAAALGRTLTDASCSGAKTDDMTAPQDVTPGQNPPQFNALTTDTQVVTLQIGGNDIGFTSILENCATANPFAHPCRDKYVVNGHDTLADKIAATAPKVAAVLQGIHTRSPTARVFVVNYAAILPETGSGCWPQVPIGFSDVPYLRSVEKNLNAMLAEEAAANGARIVDDYTAGLGRDACKSSSTRWVEPLVPANAAAPFHPNARGEAGIATVVVGAVST